MSLLLDSFWRALAYCLHPKVLLLSLVPLVLMALLWVSLGYFFWEPVIDGVRVALETSALLQSIWHWLERLHISGLKTVVAPLIVIFLTTPVIVMLSVLAVAFTMLPVVVTMVARRRFPQLARERGTSFGVCVLWSLGSTLLALMGLLVSMPLWLMPFLQAPPILLLPPLIWGWLTYRVMAFDALAEHASQEERREILRRHRAPLLVMGLFAGYLSAAPSLVWASGAMFAVYFVPLLPLAIWAYTFVFGFSSLWFTHYCLAALQALRAQSAAAQSESVIDAQVTDISPIAMQHEPTTATSLPSA
jgi:hypothetical protein